MDDLGVDLATWEARFEASVSGVPGDAAHDLQHVRRVVRSAKALAAREGARLEVVVPAAWFHDCVAVPKDSPDRGAASRLAAAEAVRRLRSWGYAEALSEAIAHAIEAHSFRAGIAPRTLEARVVQDADRLDAIGAVGIARCLMLGGSMGKPLYDAMDPFCEARDPDDGRFVVDHFYAKLLGLPAAMQTAAGRAEAARRLLRMRDFLDALKDEIV